MDATLTTLSVAVVLAPCWTLFEHLVQGGAQQSLGADAPPKMSSCVSSAVSHFAQLVMWWAVVLSAGLSSWVFNVSEWPQIMVARPDDTAERNLLAPFYAIYFGYTMHSLVKDVRRSWGNLTSLDQLSFLLHHVLAVGLVAGAFKEGLWRAGVLTRLIHDPADIFLYGSKFYQGLCDQGQGNRGVLTFLYILNCVVWTATRVLLYGVFLVQLTRTVGLMHDDSSFEGVPINISITLWAGSSLMWILQVIWMGAMFRATQKYLQSEGRETSDTLDVGQPENATLLRSSQPAHKISPV